MSLRLTRAIEGIYPEALLDPLKTTQPAIVIDPVLLPKRKRNTKDFAHFILLA